MRYWWVNQNQTHRQELAGDYLWSPKRKADGGRNPFYEFMREVAPSDLVFSFVDARIAAYGLARSHAYEAPKPLEFGDAGRNWSLIGWRVDVAFRRIAKPFRPADWIEHLRPMLPERYSPLLPDGRGLQSVYLTELPRDLALALADLTSTELSAIARTEVTIEGASRSTPEVVRWERHLQREIELNATLADTEREALILARRGQGRFRDSVQRLERACRVTGVDRPEHLRASHCKPWRDCETHAERLDGENGLMLTPSIDHLFDRGFISFEDGGRLLLAPQAHRDSLARMGVPVDRRVDVGAFRPEQRRYLEFHRDLVFLKARVRA